MTTAAPTLASITFDCVDALVAARFWAHVLRRPLPTDATVDYVYLAGEPAWSFVAVPEPKTAKNRVHLDLDVDDIAAEADHLVNLGAARLGEFNEHGYHWITLADPEGNEFDVVASTASA